MHEIIKHRYYSAEFLQIGTDGKCHTTKMLKGMNIAIADNLSHLHPGRRKNAMVVVK